LSLVFIACLRSFCLSGWGFASPATAATIVVTTTDDIANLPFNTGGLRGSAAADIHAIGGLLGSPFPDNTGTGNALEGEIAKNTASIVVVENSVAWNVASVMRFHNAPCP
jgi:hypothetical protein